MTLDAFLAYVKAQAQHWGSQKALAQHLGVSEAYLSDILNGRRDPSPKLVRACGFERVVSYQRLDKT